MIVLFSLSDKFSLKIALTALSLSRNVGSKVRSLSMQDDPKISTKTS